MEMNLSETGYDMFFKDYQIASFQYMWSSQSGAKSKAVWDQVNRRLKGSSGRSSISRASIINFLDEMVDIGILTYEDGMGKGGHHRIYYHKYDEEQLREFLAKHLITRLLEEFPDETRKAIGLL